MSPFCSVNHKKGKKLKNVKFIIIKILFEKILFKNVKNYGRNLNSETSRLENVFFKKEFWWNMIGWGRQSRIRWDGMGWDETE